MALLRGGRAPFGEELWAIAYLVLALPGDNTVIYASMRERQRTRSTHDIIIVRGRIIFLVEVETGRRTARGSEVQMDNARVALTQFQTRLTVVAPQQRDVIVLPLLIQGPGNIRQQELEWATTLQNAPNYIKEHTQSQSPIPTDEPNDTSFNELCRAVETIVSPMYPFNTSIPRLRTRLPTQHPYRLLTDRILAEVVFNPLNEQDIPVRDRNSVQHYLYWHPDMAELLVPLATKLANKFKGHQPVSLSLYQDPEIDDVYLIFFIYRDYYEDDLSDAIESVTEPFDTALTLRSGWLCVIGEFGPDQEEG